MSLQPFLKLAPALLGLGILFVLFGRRRPRGEEKREPSAAAVTSALELVHRYASFVEQAPDGIFVADLDGRYTDVNDAACRMLGYSRREILSMTIADLVPPEDAERLRATRQRLLEGQTHTDEWRLRRKDGSYLPVEVTGSILSDGRWQAFVRDISERKELETALRETNADLNRAQSVAMLGSLRVDIQRNRLSGSDEIYRIYGVPPGTLLTEDVFGSRIHPDDIDLVQQSWAAALRGELYDIEHRIVVQGQTKWVRNKAEFKHDEHGELKSAIAIVQDITEKKRLEENLRWSEARSSGILAISADALISIDEAQRITMFNDGAERIFGYAKAEVIGSPLDVLLPERVHAIHRVHVKRFAADGQVARRMGGVGTGIRGRRKNGEEFPIDATISKLEFDGKRILTVSLRDTTEQVRAAHDQGFLSEVGAVLATTLDYEETLGNVARLAAHELADICIVETVERGGYLRLRVAHRFRDQLAAVQALERLPLDLRRPHLGSTVLQTRQLVLMQEVSPAYLDSISQSAEHRRVLDELELRSLLALPLIAHGRLVGSLVLLRTMASPPYTQNDQTLSGELAGRAALAVENARLYRLAQQAIEARDDVLGVVAHDLRNPVATILMQASLMQRSGPKEGKRAEEAGARIERAATHMTRLIEDLLDVTRMEAGHLSMNRARVSAAKMVSEAIDGQKPLAAAAGVQLSSEVDRDLPELWVDRDRLLQVFENLIGNALKFTEPGGCVRVGAARRDAEVSFWVADTGRGIANDDLPHVFNRFWQARKREHGGAGLGLPIVKGIIEAHGGHIWVVSTVGKGSTFFFTIPAIRTER